MRRSELAHLKVSEIDSQRMIIRVVAGKGGKDRDLSLSPTHPSRGHFQSPLVGLRPRARDFSLEGLRPQWQAGQDDSGRDRVFTSLLSARAAQRLCPHPALRLSCQSFSGFPFGLGSTAPGFQ